MEQTEPIVFQPYTITNIVASYHLGCRINLALLAVHLPFDPAILSVKIWGLITRDQTRILTQAETHEIHTHVAKKFTNTCEIVVKSQSSIHFRIYGDGNMLITGARQLSDIWQAIQTLVALFPTAGILKYRISNCFLFQKLKELEPHHNQLSRRQFFHRIKKKLLTQQDIMMSINLTGVSVNTQNYQALIKACHECDSTILQKLIWDDTPEAYTMRKWFKLYELAWIYQNSMDSNKFFTNLKLQLDQSDDLISLNLPLSLEPITLDRNRLKVDNYYCIITANLILDLPQTYRALNQETDLIANYGEKDHGVRVSYQNRALDNALSQNRALSNALSQNNYKKVSISIYKHGKIVLSGAQTIQQIDDTYHRLQRFFSNNPIAITQILTPSEIRSSQIPNDQLPDLLQHNKTGQLYIKRILLNST